MKNHITASIFLLTIIASCKNLQQTKQKETTTKTDIKKMTDWELTIESAHPNAKVLMTEDFYWSPIEETGPFGSDDGSDSFYGLRQWRASNQTSSPLIYLRDLVEGWGYKPFDWNEMDTAKIQKYILADPIGGSMLIGQDNAIIGVGFGQFVLEGKIDQDIKQLTKIAIERELNSLLIKQFRDDYHDKRKTQLNKMLVVLDKMNH